MINTTNVFTEREERYYQLKKLRDKIADIEFINEVYLWIMDQHGIDTKYWIEKYNEEED